MKKRSADPSGKSLYITNLGLMDNLAGTQVLPYLEGLAVSGEKIKVLSYEKKNKLTDKAGVVAMRARLMARGIEWTHLAYHNRWGNLIDLAAGIVHTFSICVRENISLLHARASIPVLIAWPVSRILGINLIYDRRGTMAGDFVDDVNVKNVFSIRWMTALLDALDRFLMRHSDGVIVLSERAEKALLEGPLKGRLKTAVSAIPCCVNVARYERALERPEGRFAEGFTLCYVGSLGTCYLLDEMIDFFTALRARVPGAFFLLMSNTDRAHVNEAFLKKGYSEPGDYKVLNLAPEDVPGHIAGCDASVMFIKPVECKVGSSPTKFGESLCAGIPVVINSGIGDTEAIVRAKGVGVIVNGFTAADYAKAVSGLLTMVKKDTGLGQRCRETACGHFSLRMGIDRYAWIYSAVKGRAPTKC